MRYKKSRHFINEALNTDDVKDMGEDEYQEVFNYGKYSINNEFNINHIRERVANYLKAGKILYVR